MTNLNPNFWQTRFENNQTPWDRQASSPQLKTWLDNRMMPIGHIAIPGCGKGWEVADLAEKGFKVTGIDYTEAAIKSASKTLRDRSLVADLIQADVLTYEPTVRFDAIYEQTCLCALDPNYWTIYALQLARWLKPGGRLYALFMQVERPNSKIGLVEGPPFHCDINAMHALFPHRFWTWPMGELTQVSHPNGWHELAVVIERTENQV